MKHYVNIGAMLLVTIGLFWIAYLVSNGTVNGKIAQEFWGSAGVIVTVMGSLLTSYFAVKAVDAYAHTQRIQQDSKSVQETSVLVQSLLDEQVKRLREEAECSVRIVELSADAMIALAMNSSPPNEALMKSIVRTRRRAAIRYARLILDVTDDREEAKVQLLALYARPAIRELGAVKRARAKWLTDMELRSLCDMVIQRIGEEGK